MNEICSGEMDLMRGLSSHSLQIFDASSGASEPASFDPPSAISSVDFNQAESLACRETWRPFPNRRLTSEFEPFSLEWYRQIEGRRYARHGRWIPRLLEFERHHGEKVLCLGGGLGTDWVRYAEAGALVHHCSATAGQLAIVRRNFELRNLAGQFLHGPANSLPIADNVMDVVVLTAINPGEDLVEGAISEIYRVLRPGGKVLALVPSKRNARWWQNFWFPWSRWFEKTPRRDDGLYTGCTLKRLFDRFAEHSIHQRHLRRSDLPHIWRWMLLPLLERVMGRFLIMKAFKPVSSAMPITSAAA